MRFLLWLIAIFALAAGIAMLAGDNNGYLILFSYPYRMQISLNLAIVMLLVAFFLFYFILRIISTSFDLPGRFGLYRMRRHQGKLFDAYKEALRAYAEGRYSAAVQYAKRAYADMQGVPAAALIAARAFHAMQDWKRYAEWLDRGKKDPDIKIAMLLTEARLALRKNDFQTASAALAVLRQTGHRSNLASEMALKIARDEKQWNEMLDLVDSLVNGKALSAEQAIHIRAEAYLGLLRQCRGDAGALKQCWSSLSRQVVEDADFLATAIPVLDQDGEAQLAYKYIGKVLDKNWNSRLAAVYYQTIPASDANRCLSVAEKWLQQYPDDPGFLFSLGQQCTSLQLWGKAQHYLESSLQHAPTASTHYAYAKLLEKLKRPDEALTHYREAAGKNTVSSAVPE